MKGKSGTPLSRLTKALEAIRNLALQGLDEIFSSGQLAALDAHGEIERTPVSRNKTGPFYRHFLPLQNGIVTLLADTYRRYFKVALAHPRQVGRDPDKWAWGQLEAAVSATLEWIRDWYSLACDGENQCVRRIGTMPVVPGETASIPIPPPPPFPEPEAWRAPAWLFQISPTVGVGPLKSKHEPVTDSEEKLGAAHTRLLLKGARRVFLWELGAAIETVRNEEIAAAGASRAETVGAQTRGPNKRKGWEQRERLYRSIRQVSSRNPSLEGKAFCAELDKRHAPPHFDWEKSGEWRKGLTWKEAWDQPGLKRKIRRVRQEALNGR